MILNEVKIGQQVSISKIITESDVESFAVLSMDRNPIHFDEDFASRTFFRRRIAHGLLGVALISGALTELMGPGNLWLSSVINYEKPIFINDEITCSLSIESIDKRKIARIKVQITNQRSENVITGTVSSLRLSAMNI